MKTKTKQLVDVQICKCADESRVIGASRSLSRFSRGSALMFLICIFAHLLPMSRDTFAQSPTLTSGHVPQPEDVFKYSIAATSGVTPGSAGANQTWDFSKLSITTNILHENYVAPASLDNITKANPASEIFPNATVAIWDKQNIAFGIIYYYALKNNQFTLEGFINPGLAVRNLWDNRLIFSYPFTFNNSLSDSYHNKYFGDAGEECTDTGSSSTLGDGYGTLKLPSKTYNNVLRVKIIDNYKDSSITNGTVFTNEKRVIYSWYDAIHKQPLLKITEVNGTIKSVLVYSSGPTVGMNELTAKGSFNLYPNPVQEKCTLSYDVTSKSTVHIAIYNLLGLKVKEWNNNHAVAGHYSKELHLQDIAKGIYIVDVSFNEGVSFRQKLLVE